MTLFTAAMLIFEPLKDLESKPKRGRKPRKVRVADTTATNSPVVGNDDAAPLPSETKFIDQTELTASAKRKSQQGNVVWSDEDKGRTQSFCTAE